MTKYNPFYTKSFLFHIRDQVGLAIKLGHASKLFTKAPKEEIWSLLNSTPYSQTHKLRNDGVQITRMSDNKPGVIHAHGRIAVEYFEMNNLCRDNRPVMTLLTKQITAWCNPSATTANDTNKNPHSQTGNNTLKIAGQLPTETLATLWHDHGFIQNIPVHLRHVSIQSLNNQPINDYTEIMLQPLQMPRAASDIQSSFLATEQEDNFADSRNAYTALQDFILEAYRFDLIAPAKPTKDKTPQIDFPALILN